MNEEMNQRVGGVILSCTGLLTAAMMYKHSEGLNGPLWVGLSASCAFVLAGFALLLSQSRWPRTYAWLFVAATACLLAPGAWIALGSHTGGCSVAIPFIGATTENWLCRGAFGFGAIIVAMFLIWLFVRALRTKSAS